MRDYLGNGVAGWAAVSAGVIVCGEGILSMLDVAKAVRIPCPRAKGAACVYHPEPNLSYSGGLSAGLGLEIVGQVLWECPVTIIAAGRATNR